jgi:DNA (cytosine-5)-methyltransferase 1
VRLLDLFSGAGGCAVGYHRAGFTEIVGVDVKPQPRYPFTFVQADALEYLAAHGHEFDAIHASPPCQRYSVATFCRGRRDHHPDLVGPARDLLDGIGVPWVIENVERAPLAGHAVTLCGLMFGLRVFRHRLFESNVTLLGQPHPPHGKRRIGRDGFVCVAGRGGQLTGWAGSGSRATVPADHRNKASWERAMGIDWMTRDELAQAIPPAYTEYLGRQLADAVRGRKAVGE